MSKDQTIYRLPTDVYKRMVEVCGPFEELTIIPFDPPEPRELEIIPPFPEEEEN